MFHEFGVVNFTPHSKVGEFVTHLKQGVLMGSRCTDCGTTSFPPRADCPECLSAGFEYRAWSEVGKVLTFTTIHAAPTGFQDRAPYTVGVVDLDDGGRLLAWFGESIEPEAICIDMVVRVVPRVIQVSTEDGAQTKVYYTLETSSG